MNCNENSGKAIFGMTEVCVNGKSTLVHISLVTYIYVHANNSNDTI